MVAPKNWNEFAENFLKKSYFQGMMRYFSRLSPLEPME
jgi:hypothetical protein